MFKGVFTAIITPFNDDGSVDTQCLATLVERQVAAGVDGIVPVGTTGESPTLNYDEHIRVIETAVTAADRRIKVIAGTGANSTEEALNLTRRAKELGADGTLQVTPYYNKPNQEGLYRHFSAVADLGLPVVLYNIPGRTARLIEPETIVRLAAHPSIVAIKEATGQADAVTAIKARCNLEVLSGDDPLTLAMMGLGAGGVISVASNVLPAEVTEMVHAARRGDWAPAREIHDHCFRLFRDLLTLDTNPIPVKSAMAMMGLCREIYRLPLCEMYEDQKAVLKQTLSDMQLI